MSSDENTRSALYFVALILLMVWLTACGGGESEPPLVVISAEPIQDVRSPLESATQLVGEAERALEAATTSAKVKSEAVRIAEVQSALRKAAVMQQEAEVKLGALAKVSAELERRKNVIENDKKDLEIREKIFQMGFFASLIAAAIGVLGLVVRWPVMQLEKKLKELEIREKELALQKELALRRREVQVEPSNISSPE